LEAYVKNIKKTFIKTDHVLSVLGEKKVAHSIYKKLFSDAAYTKFKYENIMESKNALINFTHVLATLLKKNKRKSLNKKNAYVRSILQADVLVDDTMNVMRRVKVNDKKVFMYCIHQLKARGYNYNEIAEKLNVHRTTVYRMINSNASKLS
jgi:uncharacterized protein YjcR